MYLGFPRGLLGMSVADSPELEEVSMMRTGRSEVLGLKKPWFLSCLAADQALWPPEGLRLSPSLWGPVSSLQQRAWIPVPLAKLLPVSCPVLVPKNLGALALWDLIGGQPSRAQSNPEAQL